MEAAWVLREDQDISWWHCDRAGYWEGDNVYCSKCQDMLSDDSTILG
jgi:hypothetical protein